MQYEEEKDIFRIRPQTVSGKPYRLPPSLNARLHWSARAKINKAFRLEAYAGAVEARVPKREEAHILIVNRTCYLKDKDNLATSIKGIVDGLIDAGVAKDDSEKYIDLVVKQEKANGLSGQAVIVTVTPRDKESCPHCHQKKP